MAVFPHTTIPTGESSSSNVNTLVDELLTPKLMLFREITIYDEEGTILPNGQGWRWTYGNWNPTFSLIYRKNNVVQTPGSFTPSYSDGLIHDTSISVGADGRPQDVAELTYRFDYFPIDVLEGMIDHAVDTVNTAAFGSPASYTVDTMPDYWNGVVSDIVFASCMERLILDFTLWRGRLIFALGPNEVEGGGADMVSQLETLKQNAEERAYRTLDNERFKNPPLVSPPTQTYYNSVRGVGGGAYSPHGIPGYGRLRGWRSNRIWGA